MKKHKNIKRIVISVFTLMLSVMVLGCQPNTLKMLASYMEDRYPGSDFTVDHNELVSYDREYYITEVFYKNDMFPDGEIRAHVMFQNGQWVYKDNYMMLLKRSEIEEYMQKTAEEKFGNCKVFVNFVSLYLPSSFPVTADAEEVLDNCNVELIIYIPPSSPKNSDYKTQTDEFRDELLNDGHANVFGTVWRIDSQPLYDNLSAPFSAVEMDKYEDVSKKVGSFGQFPY